MAKAPRAWNFNIDFIGSMNTILWITVISSLLAVASLCTYGLNFGTDFAGGYELQVHFPKAVSETEIRDVIEPMDLKDARVQRFGAEAENSYLVLVRDAGEAQGHAHSVAAQKALAALVHGAEHLTQYSISENGEVLSVGFDTDVSSQQVQEALVGAGYKVKKVELERKDNATLATVGLRGLADNISQALVTGLKLEPEYDPLVRVEFVGPQVGAQLRNQGLMAVVYSLLFILVYVAIRFDMYFAPGAIIATLHDVILTMGFFSFFQIDFNLTVVAAILTLIGYSLNDTIVVYDRVRENVPKLRGMPLRRLVNQSINETLSRTILTSGTVFMVTASLLILGGPFIRGFAITMFVGVIVGTYSSIAVASPLYIAFREYGERNGRATKAGKVSA
jgi:preprotein translocase subunit SecF